MDINLFSVSQVQEPYASMLWSFFLPCADDTIGHRAYDTSGQRAGDMTGERTNDKIGDEADE